MRSNRRLLAWSLVLSIASVTGAQEAPTRLGVPDEAARRRAAALIEDVYRADLDAAREPAAMASLAQRLDSVARETRDDSAAAWVLWQLSCDLATRSGDAGVALTAIDQFTGRFDADRLALSADALRLIVSAPTPPADAGGFIGLCHSRIDDAIAVDRYDVADRFGEIAATAAERSGQEHLRRRAGDKLADLAESRAAFATAQPALARIAESPADSGASLKAGRYLCLIKGDWAAGLPLLARCSDPVLAEAAQRDESAAEDAPQRLAAADTWWSLADRENSLARRNLLSRAAWLYASASPGLTGFARDRADTRVRQLQQYRAAQYDPAAEPTPLVPAPAADPNVTRVAELEPVTKRVGNGELLIGSTPGFPNAVLRVDGEETREYLCVPATSQIIYELPLGARRFTALGTAAIPEDPRATRFRFAIITNRGKILARTDELTTYPAACVDIDVELPDDTKSIALVTENLSRHGDPAAIWIKPRFWRGE